MRAFVLWLLVCFGASVSAAVPAGVSASLSDALADAVTVAGLALAVAVQLMAFRWMRRSLRDGGPARMSRKEQADEIRALRRDGWSNREIRVGGKGVPN